MKNVHFPAGFTQTSGHKEGREWFYGRTIIPLAKLWMEYVQNLDLTIVNPTGVPTDGPAMLAVNHTGYWDYVYSGIPAHFHGGRLVRYMAKKEIFDTPVAGTVMRLCKHIPVDRAAGEESVKEAVARLKGGELIGIFPEATISRSFEVKEFRTGAARIARLAGVPLIPIIVWGAKDVDQGLQAQLAACRRQQWCDRHGRRAG